MSIMNKRKEEQEKQEKVEVPVRRGLSESEKAQYEKCKICRHSYWWNDFLTDTKDLECKFLRESKVLIALKPGIECELFEENLGCMHCAHRRSEPKTLINGEKLVLCKRVRVMYGRDEASLGWERMDDRGRKCESFCKKEEKE